MENWNPQKTAAWLRAIGLCEKYADICRKQGIGGRALLLLASKDHEQLCSVLNLKRGPKTVLMEHLKPHLETFDREKSLIAYVSSEEVKRWTCAELCSWLKEFGISQECLEKAEEEEINGQAFLIMTKSSELRDCLKLNEGPWIVLQHEVSSIYEENGKRDSPDKALHPMPTKDMDEPKKPLPPENLATQNISDTPPLSKEEEKLLLLNDALKLDVKSVSDPADTSVFRCEVRSIFVQRGKGANALEDLFCFIIITKEELEGINPKKLWTKIVEKTKDWMKLLSQEQLKTFNWDEESEQIIYKPTSESSGEKLCLRSKGDVRQISLDKLTDDEFQKKCFVILIDKQLEAKQKKTCICRFSFDRKYKKFYALKLKLDSKYHATFDVNKIDLKWSKHFASLKNAARDLVKDDQTLPQSKSRPTRDKRRYQTPRQFNRDCGKTSYTKGFVFDGWETGPKDMIVPIHEYKILQTGPNSSKDDILKKFVFETLRFACGCLNERTNGTIHFGVADEKESQACGHCPREIVGTEVKEEPLYDEKLTEFIGKCFFGSSKSIVHRCIRPPVFIPVRGPLTDEGSGDRVVIEVDIEPAYSFCKGETFRACLKDLNRGKKNCDESVYVRHGSSTKAIVDKEEQLEYMRHQPKLDEARKNREQASLKQPVVNQESTQDLFNKLKRLLCGNKKVIDSSVYPILVLSKPDATMKQSFLDETFRFIQKINWLTVFDFDCEGSHSSGLCKVFRSGSYSPQVDIHEAEDYDEDDEAVENIYYKRSWIFGNGLAELKKEAVGFKQWHNSKRKRGLSKVIQSFAKKLPGARAVVLFLLLSKDYQAMTDIFEEFCTYFDGPNQLIYVAEGPDIVADWEVNLSKTCLEEHELQERGIVGMSWTEFQECMEQITCGPNRDQRYVIMATGVHQPLRNVSFNIEIVSAKECESELSNLSSANRLEMSSEVEENFYRGYPVQWKNFWFTDFHKNHVLRRDSYLDLRKLIENVYSRGAEGRVQTITIYHHIGAGASTMARQALWDFRNNPKYPYRCAVITNIDYNTPTEIFQLRKIGHDEETDGQIPPVLALVEVTDDFMFRELRSQVVDQALKFTKTPSPVCVFLYCKHTQNPKQCSEKEKTSSVFLEQLLSQREVDWFKDKYTVMKQQLEDRDPERDFEEYANENLISFMIMKENYNPKYASSIVDRNIKHVTGDELTLLKFCSLLNIFNPYPVFVSCFDTLMLSPSALRKRIFVDWIKNLSHSARVFLREVDCSTHSGTGKAIAIIHPVIANELLDKIAAREEKSVSEIAVEFIESPLLQSEAKSFTSEVLREGANRMLKHRRKYEYGDHEQTKFSPLIEKILYIRDTDDGKQPTEESIKDAVMVLEKGLEKFMDPMLAQQIARVFYVNAGAISEESKKNECFDKALEYCDKAIKMNQNNSFLLDTKGRIYEKKMKVFYGKIRENNLMVEIDDVTSVFPIAFEAMKWFQESLAASVDYENKYGFHGQLSVMFYLLDVLRCTRLFRGQEGLKRLQGYLAYGQVIPQEVQSPWRDYHESIKGLRNRFSHCMEQLSEDFTIFKGSTLAAKLLPKQIAQFKVQYLSYFGEIEEALEPKTDEERWEYRWQKINCYLAGGIFSSVFKIRHFETEPKSPHETLKLLQELAYENYCTNADRDRYKDFLLYITTSMALHSPYGNNWKRKSAKQVEQRSEEYREIYTFVEKLFALEAFDERYKGMYAHLLKVMFLWPRENIELNNYRVKDFYDALLQLKNRWSKKGKDEMDVDKMLKQNVYKHMAFKKEHRQYTTLFYLGQGDGLDVFVHINELPQSRGSVDFTSRKTLERLQLLTGVVESKNIIKVKNPWDQSRGIDVYYSSFRQGGFSKEEVSFYLGFSWPQPIALNVQYTNRSHIKTPVEFYDPVQTQLSLPKNFEAYDEYTSRMGKLLKRLNDINSLKEKKSRGEKLEENQVRNSIRGFHIVDKTTVIDACHSHVPCYLYVNSMVNERPFVPTKF